MSNDRFLNLAVLWGIGGACAAVAKSLLGESPGNAQFSPIELLSYAGGFVALIGLHFALRQSSVEGCSESGELTEEMQLAAEREKIAQEREDLEQFQKQLQQQLDQRAEQLNSREVELTNRLVQFHEWLEYPGASDASPVGDSAATQSQPAALLIEQDQRVIDLLDEEAKLVYSRLRESYYNPDGQLDAERIRNQVLDVVNRVARIYRPDVENPLMETSVDQMLRAGSRACLHLLIVLDRLPLNLHEESLSTLHTYVRNAIKAWDAYSAAEPYLTHAGRAWYVGRYLAGASPLTMGITWALSEIGKRGAKAIGKKVLDEQAVALIGDVVRIIGFEVASVFSTDFRHRSPDWIYGSELTDLMSRFPVSRENLAHSLREIGKLSVRNEYDRMFLYRCLSTHRAARPLVSAQEYLPPDQRQDIANRLEKFYTDFIHGRTEKRVNAWLDGVEERFGIRLDVESTSGSAKSKRVGHDNTLHDDTLAAMESLAGFACAVKGRPIRELSDRMSQLHLAASLDDGQLRSVLQQLETEPPQLFDPPDIDPDSPILEAYFDDLISLAVELPPRDMNADDFVLETAAYFGTAVTGVQKKLDQAWLDFVRKAIPENAPSAKVTPETARQLIQSIPETESPQFIYSGVKARRPDSEDDLLSDGVLMGTQSQLILLTTDGPLRIATTDLSELSIEKIDGMVIDDCRLTGGNWHLSDSTFGDRNSATSTGESLELTIPGAVMNRFDNWFKPLLAISRQSL